MQTSEFPYRTSFWCEREPERVSRLEGTVQVDVAVIGGGFAGLSSARCIKEADPSLDVALLEAEYIGFGASGRNGGGVLPTPPLAWFARDPNEPNWKEEIRWAVEYNRQQAQDLRALIERERIDCDFRLAPLVLAAPGNLQWNLLKWMADQCEAVGFPCSRISEAELRDTVRYPGRGGIALEGYSLQPFDLARGLLQVVRSRGVRVYEDTRVVRLEPSENGADLLMENGASLHARKVVLATNAYTQQLGFVRRTPPSLHTCMIATEALNEATLERFGFRENFLGDTSLEMLYMRVYRNRLLFGGGGKLFSKANTPADQNAGYYRKLHATMLRRFDFLDSTRIEAAWGGPLHEPLNMTPVVRLAAESPNVVLNFGYGSAGVALTQFSGKMVAGLVLGKSYVDPDAERLRRMYEASRIPVREMVKLGIRFLWRSMVSK